MFINSLRDPQHSEEDRVIIVDIPVSRYATKFKQSTSIYTRQIPMQGIGREKSQSQSQKEVFWVIGSEDLLCCARAGMDKRCLMDGAGQEVEEFRIAETKGLPCDASVCSSRQLGRVR